MSEMSCSIFIAIKKIYIYPGTNSILNVISQIMLSENPSKKRENPRNLIIMFGLVCRAS